MTKLKNDIEKLIEGKKLKCGHKAKYSEKYDSYYCKECNKWLEGPCHNKSCDICSKRPNKPIL